jgi:hypothetical protein
MNYQKLTDRQLKTCYAEAGITWLAVQEQLPQIQFLDIEEDIRRDAEKAFIDLKAELDAIEAEFERRHIP